MPHRDAGRLRNNHPATHLMDDRFNRNDKPEGQEVRVSRDAEGELVLEHRVALDAASSPEARQALLQAARVAASFRHPQVLTVREVHLEGDSLVFVQDYPYGPLLADTLSQGGRVPLTEALKWMRQFAHALGAAQASGLTLSQICPTEFVVQEASATGDPGGLLCLCPPVPEGWWLEVEDPVFASPEQKNGQACDVRSSMYSACAMLGVMVTGERPLSADGWDDVLSTADLPRKVSAALKAVLKSEPGKRCAKPAEWVALLDAAIGSSPSEKTVSAAPVKAAALPAVLAGQRAPATARAPSLSQMGEATSVTESANRPGRNPMPWVAAALGVVLLAVGTWLKSTQKAPVPPVVPAKTASSNSEVNHSPPAPEAAPPPTTTPPPALSTTASSGSPPPPPAPAQPIEPPPPVVIAPRVAAAPEAGPKPVVMPQPSAPDPTPPPVPPEPSKPAPSAEVAKKTPEMAVATVLPEAKPKPSAEAVPAPPAPVVKPALVPPSKDELLRQAAAASGAERFELYRKVLEFDSHNRRALQGLVEGTLSEIPPQGAKREELMRWVNELASSDDPLGFHALGCIALQESAEARSLIPAIKSASDAITQLKHSLHSGYSASYDLMVQAYIDLHSFQLQNREKPKADRTSKALLDEIARAPDTVSASDSREFAVRLEDLLKERATKGPPRMQEAFLKTVMQSLYATAARRGDEPSQKWLKTHR